MTPHHNYNCSCATPLYIPQLWVTTTNHYDHCNHSKKHNSNNLSVHQWIRSAMRDSQQPTSPTGFLVWNFRHRLVRYYWYPLDIGGFLEIVGSSTLWVSAVWSEAGKLTVQVTRRARCFPTKMPKTVNFELWLWLWWLWNYGPQNWMVEELLTTGRHQ